MSNKIEKWIDAKRKFKLSDKHVQMAREIGLNPDKLGKLNNHKQEPWKVPLKDYIEELYFKHFKKSEPDIIRPIEQIISDKKIKKEEAKKLVESAKDQLFYIELKSGFKDDGPAWIGKIELSKSGQTVYFNGHAFKGKGQGICNELERGDIYWISRVKKNGQDRLLAGNGKIMIDKEIVNEYMEYAGLIELDKNKFEVVKILKTDKTKFQMIENRKNK
jgi:hypothetical protein